MRQIQVTEEAYANIERRAGEAGFENVSDYVADFFSDDVEIDETTNLDHRFTPEVVKHLNGISERGADGGTKYTLEEIDAHIIDLETDWRRKIGK